MIFKPVTSPHTSSTRTTASIMRLVIIATVPGMVSLVALFGQGVLINVLLTCVSALVCEALILRIRQRPIVCYLGDYSALLTAVLLGVALPPYCHWTVPVIGSAIAIIVAKHLYGGLGFNLFNPAMVAYVALLISFPVEMTKWAAPTLVQVNGQSIEIGMLEALRHVFSSSGAIDGYTMATPLDLFKQKGEANIIQLYQQESVFASGFAAGAGWEMVNLAFLLGGLFLLYKKVFSWHAPAGMLGAIILMAALFYQDGSASSGGSPMFHLLSGGTMLGAFFILTDPVTSAASNKGRLIYGAAAGVLIYIIRVWGNYPDAVAFAVLLMNFTAPFIDYYTLPRTYGHSKPPRATETPP